MNNVQHVPEQHRFIIPLQGSDATLVYQLVEPNEQGEPTAIDFSSTYVPSEFRGQGLAEQLVRAGTQWAKSQGYKLQASCWYAAKFIR